VVGEAETDADFLGRKESGTNSTAAAVKSNAKRRRKE
jgi:hypothetical protein